jgi:hypothetical protein
VVAGATPTFDSAAAGPAVAAIASKASPLRVVDGSIEAALTTRRRR